MMEEVNEKFLEDKRLFYSSIIIFCFIMKIVSEFVHEICGHGLFVLLFEGKITSINLSVLWPYESSYIGWSSSGFTLAQMAWIYAGGIVMCLCVSFLTQVFLILRGKISGPLAFALFSLAFWTFINPTGYLIIGGLTPFGDVLKLIGLGVLTRFLSLTLSIVLFAVGFIVLSRILREILPGFFCEKKISLCITLFWLIIPALGAVRLVSPKVGFQAAAYTPFLFIPPL